MTNISTVYRKSYQRIINYERENRDFFDIFYHRFMAKSEQIREKFKNTNFTNQKSVLKNSLMYMQTFYESGIAGDYLQNLACRHGPREMNIGSEMYDLWLEAFLAAVEECDPKFTMKVANAWREVLAPGIRFMQSQSG